MERLDPNQQFLIAMLALALLGFGLVGLGSCSEEHSPRPTTIVNNTCIGLCFGEQEP